MRNVGGGDPSNGPGHPAQRSSPARNLSRAWTAVLGLAISVVYLGMIGRYPLADPDEPRYAEIPREMLQLHDWVTPHLNYVKYFEKPPLVYWLTALSFEAFGIHEWSARVLPALSGLLGIAMAYVLGRVMFDPWTGVVAAALLAAAPLYFGLSQVLVLDATLTALMTVALTCIWLAYSGRHRRLFTVLAYAATALAVLTKGPTALLLPAVIVVAFLALRRDLGALRWLCAPHGLLVFAAITVPWYVLVSVRNPEFVNFFVVKQHIDRFFRPDEHKQPLWFFVPVVLAGFLPWSAFVLLAPRRMVGFIKRAVGLRLSPPALYCVIWSAVIFVIFSCSQSKLGTYVLPLFCPAAILLARFCRSVIDGDDTPVVIRGCVFTLVLGAVALAGAAIAPHAMHDPQVPQVVPSVVGAGVVLVFTAISALVAVRRRHLESAYATLLLGVLVLQGVAFTARGAATQYRAMGAAIRRQAQPQDLVVSYRQYVLGVNFYARHRLVLTGGRGELAFGSVQGDQRGFFWDGDDPLLQAWGAPRHIFLVIDRTDLDALRGRLLPAPREVAAQGKKVTVVNFD